MVETFSQLEKRYGSFYKPTFKIELDGGATVLSPAKGTVSQVRIQNTLDQANRASFPLGGVYDQSQGTFSGLDNELFSPGTSLAVEVGYGTTTEPVIHGEITSVRPRFPSSGAPTVEVTGHDYRFAMTQSSHDASWDDMTVPEIAQNVLSNYEREFKSITIGSGGPSNGVEVDDETFEKLFQSAESDFQFLTGLVDRYGYEMFSRAGEFYLRQPPSTGEPTVTLDYGGSLQSYTPAQPGGNDQVGTIEVRGYDPTTAEAISGTADRQGGGEETQVIHAPVRSVSEAEQRARARAQELDRQARSQAQTLGLPELRIGEWLELNNLGGGAGSALSYDGTYYIHEVTHTVDQSGFSSTVTLSRPTSDGD